MLGAGDTVQIEKNATLRELARQIVFRDAFGQLVAGPAAGVCDEHAACVVIGMQIDPAWCRGCSTRAEGCGELRIDVSSCQVWMRRIEREPKR